MPVNSEAYGYRPGGLWLHSYAVASTARAAAVASTDPSCAGWAYLGGLLHDVGKLIIGQMIGARASEFARAMYESEEASDAEKRVFFHSHAEVGDMIGERWKLPDAAREIIRRHHGEIPADCADIALMATVLANILCKRLRLGFTTPAGPAGATAGAGAMDEADAAQPPSRPPSEVELGLVRRMGLDESLLPAWEKTAGEASRFYEAYLAG
jgi:putative nucleotidyltransferase with HDIG domain